MMTTGELTILLLSLKVSLAAIVLAAPLAFACAWLLVRSAIPVKPLLDGVIHLPLVLPPVVTGWLLLLLLGRHGPVGQMLQGLFGVSVMFRWTGAALAAAVMAFPLMVRAMRLSLEAVDRRYEEAARMLGANAWSAFFSVTLPLCLPGIVSGAILGFGRSLGEFGATITFVSNIEGETRTLPLAIYSAMQVPGAEGDVGRLVMVSVALSLIALFLSEWFARRSAGGRDDRAYRA